MELQDAPFKHIVSSLKYSESEQRLRDVRLPAMLLKMLPDSHNSNFYLLANIWVSSVG